LGEAEGKQTVVGAAGSVSGNMSSVAQNARTNSNLKGQKNKGPGGAEEKKEENKKDSKTNAAAQVDAGGEEEVTPTAVNPKGQNKS